jgi:tetratricopeptide (TPR) repeat protein
MRQQGILAAMLAGRGTILMSAKKSEDAIAIFESARTILESLYKAGATDKLSTVASCDVKMGQVVAQAGHQQAAAEYFHRALTVAEPLMSSATADLDALYAAADAYSGLGELSMRKAQRTGHAAERRKANWTDARSSYLLSLNTWHRIELPNHTAPNRFEVGDPATVAEKLKLTEEALSLSN